MPAAISLVDTLAVLRLRIAAQLAAADAQLALGIEGDQAKLCRLARLQAHQLRKFVSGGNLSPRSIDRLAEAFNMRIELVSKDVPRGRWAG